MLSFPQAIFKKGLIPAAGLVLLLAAVAPAADSDSAGRLRREAAEVGRKLEEARESARDLGEKERSLADELDRLERELDEARRAARNSREAVARMDREIAEAEAAFAQLTDQLREGRRRAATRAVSLYKLHALGTVHLLAGAGSVGEFFERSTALRRVLAQDEALMETLGARRAELDLLSGEIETRRREREAANEARRTASAELERRRKARGNLLARVRREKSLAAEAVAALREAAAALDRRIESLGRQARARAAGGAFARHKGLLNMPVTGKITSFFGPFENPEFGIRNFRSGIVIRTEEGAPIRAVESGEVIYANWFKGYGNMIIVDHGDHYYTLYAHAGELFKAKGETVRAGDVIAAAGAGGGLQGGPGLHFEVRHHGKPLDPMEWLKTG